MTPIAIDFAHPSRPAHTLRWRMLLSLGVLLCASSLWGAWAWQRAEAQQRAHLAEITPGPTDEADALTAHLNAHLSPAQTLAVHDAVARLNTPWVSWLAALERHLPLGATVTQIELRSRDDGPAATATSAAQSTPVHAKLSLQARQVDDMVTLLNALKRDPLFARLNVTRQDLTPSDEGVWVQFAVEGPLVAPLIAPLSAPTQAEVAP